MSGIKKAIKDNKYTTVVFCLFLGFFLLAWVLYGIVMPSDKEKYGDRLKGIEKVEVTETNKSDLVTAVEKVSFVSSCKVHVSGKIINVIVEVKSGTKVKLAKTIKTTVLKNISDDKKDFYDIQLFIINQKSDTNGYPVIGYKNSSEKYFVF